MTLLGKIFTVLILLMTVLFMSFSVVVFATHRSWKAVVWNETATATRDMGLHFVVLQKDEEIHSLEKQIKTLNAKLAVEQLARAAVLARIESEKIQALQAADEFQKNLIDARAEFNRLATLNRRTRQIYATMYNVNQSLRDFAVSMIDENNGVFKDNVVMSLQLDQLQGDQRRWLTRSGELIERTAMLTRLVRSHSIDEQAEDRLPKDLGGRITAVKSDRLLVEISLGSDDGVKPGHAMIVYRGKDYRGQIEIVKTQADRAVAKILVKLQRGRISIDDNVVAKGEAPPLASYLPPQQ
ncbi:MAG: cell division protein FtsL [Pirellulaceae bacterium]|jgi:cell division protein FtsL